MTPLKPIAWTIDAPGAVATPDRKVGPILAAAATYLALAGKPAALYIEGAEVTGQPGGAAMHLKPPYPPGSVNG